MADDIAYALKRVLGDPVRLRALFSDGLSTPAGIVAFLLRIVPQAARTLDALVERAHAIADPELREQAVASATKKAYHVAGAAILATFLDDRDAARYIAVVAPLETIYDYLDNLCDRHPAVDTRAYPILHQAIADALDPDAPLRDYYAAGPTGDDSGYLRYLVSQSQDALRGIPHLDTLRPYFSRAAALYAEMQTFKHLPAGQRELALVDWFERERGPEPIDWHEFTCAAGSQFHVYGPLFAALTGDDIGAVFHAYFPYVCALHVLLDAIIDRDEDRATGELNLADVYAGESALLARFSFLCSQARLRIAQLSESRPHRFVLDVMILFYLSHPKTAAREREARQLLRANRN